MQAIIYLKNRYVTLPQPNYSANMVSIIAGDLSQENYSQQIITICKLKPILNYLWYI